MRGSGKAHDLGCTCGSGAQDRKRGSELKWGLAITVEDRFVQATWAEQEQRVEGRALETFRVFIHSFTAQIRNKHLLRSRQRSLWGSAVSMSGKVLSPGAHSLWQRLTVTRQTMREDKW